MISAVMGFEALSEEEGIGILLPILLGSVEYIKLKKMFPGNNLDRSLCGC
jgi:hypothetical protein